MKHILILLLIIAVGIWAFLTLFDSEEKRVKKQFHLLSEGVSKESDENIFTLDQKIKKIGSLFEDSCEMKIPDHSLSGSLSRDEITGYAARGRLHFSQLHLTFHDMTITFIEEGVANVHLTARLTGRTKTGESLEEAHELNCLLKKTDKKWLFNRVEIVEVLKK
jgi:hypothetical protein